MLPRRKRLTRRSRVFTWPRLSETHAGASAERWLSSVPEWYGYPSRIRPAEQAAKVFALQIPHGVRVPLASLRDAEMRVSERLAYVKNRRL